MATDIRLDDTGQLTRATDGDAPLISGEQELLQRICMEAQTQPGELFYAPDWGWGLRDYLQDADSDMLRLEIGLRIRTRLRQYEEIDPAAITIDFVPQPAALRILVGFGLISGGTYTIQVILDRVAVEVMTVDQ